MNINVDKKEDCTASIAIEVPAEKVTSNRNEIVKSFSKNADLKGFRKGKAPASVIEKRYAGDIQAELQNRLINDAIYEATQKDELQVINVSIPEEPTFTEEGTFKFLAEAVLAPTFDLPKYKELEVTTPPEEVSEDEINSSLEEIRQRFADFNDTEVPLEKGQFAIIDYKSNIDGKEVEEVIGKSAGFIGGREGQWVKIEDDSFLPGFVEEISGLKVGDNKVIPIDIKDDFPIEALRGQTVNFDVTIKETKEQVLPELNDEFAAKLLSEGTMDDVKKIITEQLGTEKTRQIGELKVQQVMQQLSESTEFTVPDQTVKAEAQNLLQQSIRSAAEKGIVDDALEEKKAEMEKAANNQAEANVRSTFILQRIAKEEGIVVSDNDLLNRVSQMAEAAKKPVKAYIKEIQKAGAVDNIKHSLLLGKAVDFVVDSAKVTIEEPKTEEADA